MTQKPKYFINEKGDICFNMVDEHDHQYTVRMDNPLKLNAEEATEMMESLSCDIKKEKEDGQVQGD